MYTVDAASADSETSSSALSSVSRDGTLSFDDACEGGWGAGEGWGEDGDGALGFEDDDRLLYSAANLRARGAARRDPGVRKLIELFYRTCVIDSASCHVVRGVARYDWVKLQLLVFKALRPACDWDEAAARATIEQDRRRSGGDDVISRDAFANSLAELVDAWAVGTSGDEYRSFLRTLFLRVTKPSARASRGDDEGVARISVDEADGAVTDDDSARRLDGSPLANARALRFTTDFSTVARGPGGDASPSAKTRLRFRHLRPLHDVRACDERPSPDDADTSGCVDCLMDAMISAAAAAAGARSPDRRHGASTARELATEDAAAAAAARAQASERRHAAVQAAAAAPAREQQECRHMFRNVATPEPRVGRRTSLRATARPLSSPTSKAELYAQRRRALSPAARTLAAVHGDDGGARPMIAMFDRSAMGSTMEVRLPTIGGGFSGAMGQRLALPARVVART